MDKNYFDTILFKNFLEEKEFYNENLIIESKRQKQLTSEQFILRALKYADSKNIEIEKLRAKKLQSIRETLDYYQRKDSLNDKNRVSLNFWKKEYQVWLDEKQSFPFPNLDNEDLSSSDNLVYYLSKADILIIQNLIQDIKNGISTNSNGNMLQVKHPNIFVGYAFHLWEILYFKFDIGETKRTDTKFLFEELKKHNYIYETIYQKDFLNWISTNYEIVIEKTSNHHRTSDRIKKFGEAESEYQALIKQDQRE